MGGTQQAQTTNEQSTFNTTDIGLDQQTINNISQVCDIENKNSNLVQIVGSTVNNLNINQKNAVKTLCQMQQAILQTQDSKAQTEVLNKLSQAAEASSKGGFLSGPGSSSANNISKTYNDMRTKMSQTQINNVTSKCLLDQSTSNIVQIFGSDVQNSSVDQLNDSFAQCVNAVNTEMKSTATAEEKTTTLVDQTATSQTKSGGIGDMLTSLASGMASLLPFVFPIFIGIILLICLSSISSGSAAMSGGGGSSGSSSGGGGSSFPKPSGFIRLQDIPGLGSSKLKFQI